VEEEFIGAIRGTEPVKLTTFADGVKYMEFTEAVARSLESGTARQLRL
jgi:predicted dehydrogenase